MLILKRSLGTSVVVDTPAGEVRVTVVAVNSNLRETTLAVDLPADLEGTGLHRLATDDRLTIQTPAGPFDVVVQGFDVGPAAHQYAMSVKLGVEAPREWRVLRDNAASKVERPT